MKVLITLRESAGWSGSVLGAYVWRYVFWGCGWFIFNDRFYLSFFVATSGFRDSALTSIEFCINPRKNVDHVCILVRQWIDTNQKVVRFVLDLWFKSPYEPLRKLALIHVRTKKVQISLRVHADWSVFVVRWSSFFSLFFFDGEASQAWMKGKMIFWNVLVSHRICHFRAIQPFDYLQQ